MVNLNFRKIFRLPNKSFARVFCYFLCENSSIMDKEYMDNMTENYCRKFELLIVLIYWSSLAWGGNGVIVILASWEKHLSGYAKISPSIRYPLFPETMCFYSLIYFVRPSI